MLDKKEFNNSSKKEVSDGKEVILKEKNRANNNFKRIIVTSALPYVNNIPHIGNMVCVISADCYARYLKSKGENVVSVLGTDEHGTTTEIKAIEEGVSPKEITDKYFKIHKKIYDFFLCEPDCFGRTSSKENHEITKELFGRLDNNGYISEDSISQFYCERCDRFLADRFVIGTCGFCGYEKARGDQCESCGKLLDVEDLRDVKCSICNAQVVLRESKHLFLELPKLSLELQKFVDERKSKWSVNALTMTNSWISGGLKKRCITRDLKWGIPVPKQGFEGKVFYSWFDAPIGYIGITAENRKEWRDWWKSDDTRLVQFMGKDNIPFHTILFPAILMGARDGYVLLDSISVNEYLNYEDGKISKSEKRGIFGDDAIEIGLRADVWRYYLIINRPEKTDTVFIWQDFMEKVNNELVATLGNLVNRVLTFVKSKYGSVCPEGILESSDEIFLDKIKMQVKEIERDLDLIEIKSALKGVMGVARLANQYMQENKPWQNSKQRADACVCVLLNVIKDLGVLCEPFMPGVSKDIFAQLNIEYQNWNNLFELSIRHGHEIGTPNALFEKLDDKRIDELKRRYSGRQKEIVIEKKKIRAEGRAKEIDVIRDFSDLDLRVGIVKEAISHPNADKLLIMKVDVGEKQIQLVAGLKKFYSPEEIVGKRIIVVNNLKHANLRGFESEGMLLAGGPSEDLQDDEKISKGFHGILYTDKSPPGTKIVITGGNANGEPIKELTIDEFYSNYKIVVKGGKAFYNGKVLKAEDEEVMCDRVKNGLVR